MAFSRQFSVKTNGDIVSTTDTFLELVPSEQERQDILEILNNEKEGNGNSQGSQC